MAQRKGKYEIRIRPHVDDPSLRVIELRRASDHVDELGLLLNDEVCKAEDVPEALKARWFPLIAYNA